MNRIHPVVGSFVLGKRKLGKRKPRENCVTRLKTRMDCRETETHEIEMAERQSEIQPAENPETKKCKAEDEPAEKPCEPRTLTNVSFTKDVKESESSGTKAITFPEILEFLEKEAATSLEVLTPADVPRMTAAYQRKIHDMLTELDYVIRLKSILKEGAQKHLSVLMVQLRGTMQLINDFICRKLAEHEGLASSDDKFNAALIKTAFPMDPILNDFTDDLWNKVISTYAKLWQGEDALNLDEETGRLTEAICGKLTTQKNVSQSDDRNVIRVENENGSSRPGTRMVIETPAEVHANGTTRKKKEVNEPATEKANGGEKPADDWDENYILVQGPANRGGRGRAVALGLKVNRGGLINDLMNGINPGPSQYSTRGRGRGRGRAHFPAYYGSNVEQPPPGLNQPYVYTTEDWDREFLEREKSCFKCHGKDHLLRDCPLVKKNQAKKRPNKDKDGAAKKKFKKSKKKSLKKGKKHHKKKARKVSKSSDKSSASSSSSSAASSSTSSCSESDSSSDTEQS